MVIIWEGRNSEMKRYSSQSIGLNFSKNTSNAINISASFRSFIIIKPRRAHLSTTKTYYLLTSQSLPNRHHTLLQRQSSCISIIAPHEASSILKQTPAVSPQKWQTQRSSKPRITQQSLHLLSPKKANCPNRDLLSKPRNDLTYVSHLPTPQDAPKNQQN